MDVKPDGFEALREKGDAYFHVGIYDKALAEWEEALTLRADPELQAKVNGLKGRMEADQHLVRAASYLKTGEYERVRDEWRQALASRPDPALAKRLAELEATMRFETHRRRAEELAQGGLAEAAVDELKHALEVHPDDAGIKQRIAEARAQVRARGFGDLVGQGDKLLAAGLPREAIRVWADALDLIPQTDPRWVEVWKRMQKARRGEKTRKAVIWAVVVIASGAALVAVGGHFAKSSDESHRDEASDAFAHAEDLARSGEKEDAIRAFTEVCAKYADTDWAQKAQDRIREVQGKMQASLVEEAFHHAEELEKSGNLEEAAKQYGIVVEKFPGSSFGGRALERIRALQAFGRGSKNALYDAEEQMKAEHFEAAIEEFNKVLADDRYRDTDVARAAEKGIKKARFFAAGKRANELLKAGKPDAALGAFRDANKLAEAAGEKAVDTSDLEERLKTRDEADGLVARANAEWAIWKGDLAKAGKFVAEAKRLRPDDTLVERLAKFVAAGGVPRGMVYVPGGEAVLGGADEAFPDELPPHVVDLKPFLMATCEVTNGQYWAFVKETGRIAPLHWKGKTPPQGTEMWPVVNVSWEDAEAYARWAGSPQAGSARRLPTEAEWEKAARWPAPEETNRDKLVADAALWDSAKAKLKERLDSGSTGLAGDTIDLPNRWPWGDEFDAERCVSGGKGPEQVGSHALGKSPLGCLDMAGNVWEWTSDWYEGYSPKASSKYFGEKFKVIRGGSWKSKSPDDVRTSNRSAYQPRGLFADVGFRCVQDLPDAK